MPRSSFGLASLLAGLTVLNVCGTASAQWFPGFGGGSNCGCSAPAYMGTPPIMQQSAAAFGAAPISTASYAYQSGPPVACHIETPVQVVHVPVVQHVAVQTVAVQQLQPVIQPVMQDVAVTEYHPVKQTVSKPVVRTEYVDQLVTEMRPVTEQKTANVQTVSYQNVTEYKQVQKQVGYWATQNCPTGKVPSWQYDNRQNVAGFMNRASYDMRNAFTPMYKQTRTFVPQTMTCTVPYSKQVAVPGMKQVTYNVTRMEPMQTTRKVAVNKVVYEPTEVTVLKPVQVVKSMHVGTRVSYAPIGSGTAIGSAPGTSSSPAVGLKPTPEANQRKRSAEKSDSDSDNRSGATAPEPKDTLLSDSSVSAKKFSAPSIVRVNQWVARTPALSTPQPGGKSAAMSIADSSR